MNTLQRIPIASLTPNAANPRKITDKRKAQLRKSLREFGNLSPITWNKTTGNVIGGNQRLEAYRDTGETEVDVWVVELDAVREKAAIVALNNHSGEWDSGRLAALIEALQAGGQDLELTGFETREIDKLLNSLTNRTTVDAQVDQCAAALDALVVKWGVKLGQVWTCGDHRIACGDCTMPDVVAAVLGGDKPHLMVTDPPYGVELD